MKKVLALMAAATVISGSAFADGAVNLTTWDSGKPIYYLTSGTLAGGSGFYAQVLSGGVPIVSTTPGVGNTFAIDTDGNFDAGFGMATGIAPSTSGELTLRVWKGTSTYDPTAPQAQVSWNQVIGDNPAAPTLPVPASLNIPSSLTIVAVPEPSTIALGMLGAAALLIRRRK